MAVTQHLAKLRVRVEQLLRIGCSVHDADGRTVERGAITLGRLLGVGNVLDHADRVHRLAELVAGHRLGPAYPHHTAVLVDVTLLSALADGFTLHEQRAVPPGRFDIIRVRDVIRRSSDQLALAVAQHFAPPAVHAQILSVHADERHSERRVVERELEPALELFTVRDVFDDADQLVRVAGVVGGNRHGAPGP